MKNEYRQSFEKYPIRDSVKQKLFVRITKKTSYRLSYAILALFLICTVSISVVYADEIREVFKTWTAKETSADIPENANVDITAKKTNLDNTLIQDIKVNDSLIPIRKIEDFLGVKLLKYQDTPAVYHLIPNDDGYVESITINYETLYKNHDWDYYDSYEEYHFNRRDINLLAVIPTKYYKDDFYERWFGYISPHTFNNDHYQTIELENLGVTAVYYDRKSFGKNEDENSSRYTIYSNLYFSYDGIAYLMTAYGMTKDEVIAFAKDLKA